MNKTAIEWCDYTVNPVKGLCPVACPYCYARRMYKRFHWDETIRFDNRAFSGLDRLKSSSRIFVGSTMELFGPWVTDEMMAYVLRQVRNCPEHTFIFLTKRPQELQKYNPWPENCWVGASASDALMAYDAYVALCEVDARVRFASFEPLLEDIGDTYAYDLLLPALDWVIIGQQTPVQKDIPRGWVDSIVNAADGVHVPVFMKNNLLTVIGTNYEGDYMRVLRQEWPRP
jgi:protein gp37